MCACMYVCACMCACMYVRMDVHMEVHIDGCRSLVSTSVSAAKLAVSPYHLPTSAFFELYPYSIAALRIVSTFECTSPTAVISTSAAVLKDQVCSPGGTTIAAVEALEKNGFRGAAIAAVVAATNKSLDMRSAKK